MAKRKNPAKPDRISMADVTVPVPLSLTTTKKPTNPAQETPAYMEIYGDKKGNKA